MSILLITAQTVMIWHITIKRMIHRYFLAVDDDGEEEEEKGYEEEGRGRILVVRVKDHNKTNILITK